MLKIITPNMTVLTIGDKEILFSYETPVAVRYSDASFLVSSNWFSKTTTAHINKWVGKKNPRAVSVPHNEIVAHIS